MRLCLYHAKTCSEKRCQFLYCSKIKKNQNLRGLKRKNHGKMPSDKHVNKPEKAQEKPDEIETGQIEF